MTIETLETTNLLTVVIETEITRAAEITIQEAPSNLMINNNSNNTSNLNSNNREEQEKAAAIITEVVDSKEITTTTIFQINQIPTIITAVEIGIGKKEEIVSIMISEMKRMTGMEEVAVEITLTSQVGIIVKLVVITTSLVVVEIVEVTPLLLGQVEVPVAPVEPKVGT